MLELKNISHKFENTWILKNISCNFSSEKYLITGKSGSGKTTLFNIAASIIKPTIGTVKTNKKIGVIFQDFNLLNDFTVKENIEIAMKIKGFKGFKEFFDEIVNITDIKHILNKFPDQISGGEKQRAAIARALLDGSNFIIADEPTGSLDPYNTLKIIKLFDFINQHLKIGILISSHDQVWKKHCDEILELGIRKY